MSLSVERRSQQGLLERGSIVGEKRAPAAVHTRVLCGVVGRVASPGVPFSCCIAWARHVRSLGSSVMVESCPCLGLPESLDEI